MAKATIQCDNPDELIKKVAMAIRSVSEVSDAKRQFNNAITEAGNGKIGAANQRLLDSIVEVGGSSMDKVIDALTVDLNDNILEPAFSAYFANTGEHHPLDTAQ